MGNTQYTIFVKFSSSVRVVTTDEQKTETTMSVFIFYNTKELYLSSLYVRSENLHHE